MRTLAIFGSALLTLATVVTTASAQFGNGGFFSDMLNQALPRVQPTNPNAPPGYPTSTNVNSFPTNTNLQPNTNGWSQGQLAGRPRDWSLGVAIDNTDVGAVIRQVQPNSPAQQAGLEPGDIVVAMGGAQVGLVEGRLNDVGDQIRRSADVNGRVRALVLDGRSSRLQNIDINLDSSSTGLNGAVFTLDRGNLPFGSIMTVKLENASRPFYEVSGGMVTLQVSGPGPFPFEMHFDPRYIDARDQYRVNATITDSRGQLVYAMRQPTAYLPGSGGSNIRLELESLRDLQMGSTGGVITASYPGDPNVLNQIYQQLLGRLPSAKEQVAWGQYLAQGNSINDLKAKILGSPNFYDRVGNNPQVFIQTMIQSLKGQAATAQEVTAWLNRLQQYQGQREEVVREFLQQLR